MAVSVNATAVTPTNIASGTSATNTTLTVPAGSTAVLAWISFDSVISGVSVTWDSGGTNQAMTSLVSTISGEGSTAFLFGLVNPAAGNLTLAAAWTGTSSTELTAVSFAGSDATSATTAFVNHQTKTVAAGTAHSMFVPGTTGNICVVCAANETSSFSSFTTTNSVLVFSGGGRAYAYAPSLTGGLTWSGPTGASTAIAFVSVDVCPPSSTVTLITTSGSNQAWSIPNDVVAGTVLAVELWGAGSGGSGSSTSFRSGGAGGAWTAGSYTVLAADMTTGTISFFINTGSAGTGAANPSAGPDTWFVSSGTLLAKGGQAHTGTAGGVGGAAASCLPSATAFSGGSGASRTQGGGAGGSAGPDGAGGSTTSGTGGTGDTTLVSAGTSDARGGGGATASTTPATGGAPGGGGGANTSTGNGSTGGRGQIRITYAIQPPSFQQRAMLPIMAQ